MKYIKKYEKTFDIDDLMTSINSCDIKKIIKILSSGVDVNSYTSRTYPALHLSLYCNNTDIIDLLLEYGANIDAINKNNGDTTLIEYCNNSELYKEEDKKILYYLIDKGADWTIKNFQGHDFFHAIHKNMSLRFRFSESQQQKLIDDIIEKYPEKYEDYLIKKNASNYNL